MQLLRIEAAAAKPIYQQILDQIREAVRDGRLAPDTALPSVRQLAAELEINPNTVSKAYLLLEREGVVRTVPRRGVFVAGRARDSAALAVDQRMDTLIDRLLEETAELGIPRGKLLESLQRRLTNSSDRRPKKRGGSP